MFDDWAEFVKIVRAYPKSERERILNPSSGLLGHITIHIHIFTLCNSIGDCNVHWHAIVTTHYSIYLLNQIKGKTYWNVMIIKQKNGIKHLLDIRWFNTRHKPYRYISKQEFYSTKKSDIHHQIANMWG